MLAAGIVADSLTALPAWRGDAAGIWREVEATEEQLTTLVSRIHETESTLDHGAALDKAAGVVTVTLGRGGVTAVDIAMASRIEDLVAASTGLPAEHAHHEVAAVDLVAPAAEPPAAASPTLVP